MTDLFPDRRRTWRVRFKHLLLDFDARLDFSVFQSGKWARDVYERFTTFMGNRFHIAVQLAALADRGTAVGKPQHSAPAA